MRCNDAGIEIIKHFEGWSAKAYQDPIGIWTIGYGSIWDLDGERVTGSTPVLTEAEGEQLLRRELHHVEKAVSRLILVELTENAFSSLCSFTYNLGSTRLKSSTLRAKLNRGDYMGASAEFPKWRRAGGRILPGLVRRRVEERKLFEA